MPELLTDARFLMLPLHCEREKNCLRLFPSCPEITPQLDHCLFIRDYREASLDAAYRNPDDYAIVPILWRPARVIVYIDKSLHEKISCYIDLREPEEESPEELFSITGWHSPFYRRENSPLWHQELASVDGIGEKTFVILMTLTSSRRQIEVVSVDHAKDQRITTFNSWIKSRPYSSIAVKH